MLYPKNYIFRLYKHLLKNNMGFCFTFYGIMDRKNCEDFLTAKEIKQARKEASN